MGKNYHGKMTHSCSGFLSAGKLFTLTLSKDNKFLAGSGDDNVYYWKVGQKYGKTLYIGDDKTVNIISPNGENIISANSNSRGYFFNFLRKKGNTFYWYPNKVTGVLKKFRSDLSEDRLTGVVSIKYIDESHILVFYVGYPNPFNYAMLYSAKDLGKKYYHMPIKYLPLIPKGSNMVPITNSYVRDQTIDTSPSAHILVMAQAENNGILVYKYNPKTQTLKRIWAPVIK